MTIKIPEDDIIKFRCAIFEAINGNYWSKELEGMFNIIKEHDRPIYSELFEELMRQRKEQDKT